MDAINSCSIRDHQVSISCLKTYKPLYHVIDFSLSCSSETRWSDGGYNITTRHDFHPEKPHSFKGILWKVLLKFVHYVVCLLFFLISFFGITVIITWHDQLLLSSSNLVEIHFLGLQTRVLHLMPAALRTLTAATAHPAGTCFVTGTSKTVNYNKQNLMVFG